MIHSSSVVSNNAEIDETTNIGPFCIVGDGEMQEGQVWESIMLAPKFNLDNLNLNNKMPILTIKISYYILLS